jgi:hypothetical protein
MFTYFCLRVKSLGITGDQIGFSLWVFYWQRDSEMQNPRICGCISGRVGLRGIPCQISLSSVGWGEGELYRRGCDEVGESTAMGQGGFGFARDNPVRV